MARLVIVGRGDHASVVADVARAVGREPAGFVDPSAGGPGRPGSPDAIGDLETDLEWLSEFAGCDFIVGIGNNRVRAYAFDLAQQLGLVPTALVHPSSLLLGGATIGPGALVCAGTIAGVRSRVEANAVVNTGATVDHDNVIGFHASVGPGVHLAGRVTIGEGAHVGVGAAVREGLSIGSWSVVGAGAAVVRDVPPDATWVGVPARPIEAGIEKRASAD